MSKKKDLKKMKNIPVNGKRSAAAGVQTTSFT